METDEQLIERLFRDHCPGWGAFWSAVSEARGEALDEIAELVGVKRHDNTKLIGT